MLPNVLLLLCLIPSVNSKCTILLSNFDYLCLKQIKEIKQRRGIERDFVPKRFGFSKIIMLQFALPENKTTDTQNIDLMICNDCNTFGLNNNRYLLS